jgi:DNA-binding NarL/FixJ family response regulator
VLIADDHAPTRAMIRGAVESGGFEVIGEVPDAYGAIREARDTHPDVALLDVRMPGGGLYAAEVIASGQPDVSVVMLTVSADEDDFFSALSVGASGYLLKGQDPAEIPKALARVLSGEAAVDGMLAKRLVQEFRSQDPGRKRRSRLPNGAKLTPKEWEVLELLNEGSTTKEIAAHLQVEDVTVRTHLSNIYRKLNATSRSDALGMVRSHRQGLETEDQTSPGASLEGGRVSLDQILKDLSWIAESRTQSELQLAEWVRMARSLGASWTRIGDALGMTRQSAWQRFSGEE